MAEELTAEELKARIVAAMPKPLGELYYALHNEIVWVHLKWNDFRGLYAASQEVIDLLNEAAPAFFHRLQWLMWGDVLLHLCRLTDKPNYGPKHTLTIRRIASDITDLQLKRALAAQAEIANEKTEFAREWRNRRLAHQELPPLDGGPFKPLPDASRQHVEDALASIRDTISILANHYLHWLPFGMPNQRAAGGIDSLLSRLRMGVAADRAELDHLRGK